MRLKWMSQTICHKLCCLDKELCWFKLYDNFLFICHKIIYRIFPAIRRGFRPSRMTSNNWISPMRFCYNTNSTLPKQCQSSRSVLQDGSRTFGRKKPRLITEEIRYCGNIETWWLTLLHSERPKLHTTLVFLSAIGLIACHGFLEHRQLQKPQVKTYIFLSLELMNSLSSQFS